MHMSINKTQHAYKKRIISQAFSDNAMRAMECYVIQVVDNFCAKLVDEKNTKEKTETMGQKPEREMRDWSSERNMADWSDYLAFDIMGTLCFGKSFGMLDSGTNRYILDTLREATSGLHTVTNPRLSVLWHTYKVSDSPYALALEIPGQ